ncbi:MAG: hypothetical protein HZB91_02125 [Elusimicrobia bacterium]|nr:hypothetical protein [Elusimicrobiota bacterium]
MIPHPLEGASSRTLGWTAALCGLIALGGMAFLIPAGNRLKSRASPNGIVSFELAASPSAMADIIAEWGPERTRLARRATWVDFPFIAGYAGALMCAALGLAGKARASGREAAILPARMAAWAMTAAALLDAAENILGLRILAGSISPGTMLMAGAAGLKFLLIAAALGLITGAWIKLAGS